MRKSSRVTLVLIGLAALGGCSQSRQDVYASREDCLADWGNKPEDCKPSTNPKHAGMGYFVGPLVAHSFWGRGLGWRGDSAGGSSSSSFRSSTSSSGSRSTTSRGGFGSSSRSSSG
jgi:uncharacterized protein YgiB involved in biofilm formation